MLSDEVVAGGVGVSLRNSRYRPSRDGSSSGTSSESCGTVSCDVAGGILQTSDFYFCINCTGYWLPTRKCNVIFFMNADVRDNGEAHELNP